MKRKALWKDFFMEIKKTLNRFLSIFFIVALGVGFFAGIRSTKPDMRLTADSYYDDNDLMDIRVLSTLGLTEGDVEAISDVEGVNEVESACSTHVVCNNDGNEFVLEVMSLTNRINQVALKEGRLPEKKNEAMVDAAFITSTGKELGDTIKISSGTDKKLSETLNQEEYTIVGIGYSPYYLSYHRGNSEIGNGKVDSFIVVLPEVFNLEVYTTVYATVEGAKEQMIYTEEYDLKVETVVERIKSIADVQCQNRYDEIYRENEKLIKAGLVKFEKPKWYVLDRESNEAYVEYGQNADRIGAIGKVFPVVFFLVAALISLNTMTRMVEEERIQIGTLKALGYSKRSIAMKYMLYALLATLGGSIFGALIGLRVLPYIIISEYKIMYEGLPEPLTPFNTYYAGLATTLAVLTVGIATYLACYKELLAKPAQLMRPRAPKSGKRVVLERIPFLWNRLNFTWKATIRNLVRYKMRFFMTIFGIGGCMSLLLVGFGLKDSIYACYSRQYSDIMLYDASISVDQNADENQLEELEEEIGNNELISFNTKVKDYTVDISNDGTTKNVKLYVPSNIEDFENVVNLRSRIGHEQYKLNDEGVILTEQVAGKLDVGADDSITITKNDTVVKVKITAITENYLGHNVYMSPNLYRKLFGEEAGYNEYLLLMPGTNEDTELQVGNSLLDIPAATGIFYVSYYRKLLSDVMTSLNVVVYLLVISAGALAFMVIYNLNNININERRRELATIKVLGFYNKELASYVYRENIVLTIIGIMFGVVFGIILHRYVILTVEVDYIMFGRNIEPKSFVYSILLTILFSVFVNFVMYFKLKKINMVESLKSVE